MKTRYLTTTALAGLTVFALSAGTAFADCQPNPPTDGQTVTCTATDNTGVSAPAATGVQIDVDTGADVTTAGTTVELGSNATINIDTGGQVVSTGGTSLITGGNSTININGTLRSDAGTAYTYNGNAGETLDMTIGGTVTGNVDLGASDANFTLLSGSTVTGTVTANGASDRFILGGIVDGAFDVSTLGAGYNGFESFEKTGTSTWALSGTGTYTTGTTISGGTISAGSTDNLGSNTAGNTIAMSGGGALLYTGAFNSARNMTIGTGGGTIDTNGFNTTITGVISGAGRVTKTGAGTLTLSATNTFTGGLSISGGTVIAGNTAHLGSNVAGNSIAITNGGILQYSAAFNSARAMSFGAGGGTINTNGFNSTISGALSGAGLITKAGTGNLTLTGTNTFTGGLTITGGTVIANNSARLGSNTAANTITLNGGALQFGAAFTSARNMVIDAGNGTINSGTFANTISGIISGAGTLTKSGTGTLTLTGANTFTGGLNITAGTISANSTARLGANTAANTIALTNGGTLLYTAAFDSARNMTVGAGGGTINTGTFNTTLSGDISGAGTLTKSGTGTMTLTGANTFSNLTLNAGTVVMNGTGTVATAVNNGATLLGTGTTGNVTVNNGGRVAGGNSIGTLNVNGTVSFASGAQYDVEYDAATADRITATGAVTIDNGAVLNIIGSGAAGTYQPNTVYTILSGSAVTGTFGTVNSNLVFLTATQTNTGTALTLNLARNNTSFADVALNEQQKDVARAVTALGTGNPVFEAFTSLTAQQAQDAMDDLSGQHNAGVATAMAQSTGFVQSMLTTHMNALSHDGRTGDTAALISAQDPAMYTAAYLEPAAGMRSARAWMQMIGSQGRSDANHTRGTPEQKRHSYGGVAGIDLPFQKGFIGFVAGYERGEITTNSQGASSDIDNYHLGGYATSPVAGGMTVSGAINGTYHSIETQRRITFGGADFAPQGDTGAWTASAFAQISKPMALHGFAVEPFAGISLMYNNMNGYSETGGGGAGLTVADYSATNTATLIGTRFGKMINLDGSIFNLTASLGWQHMFGDMDGRITQNFTGSATTFSAFAAARARDAAVVSLGADANINDIIMAYLGYDGAYSSDNRDHGFRIGLKLQF